MQRFTPDLRRDAKVIALVGVAHSISHFFQLILAPLFPWLKDAFALSYAELGLLMTAFFVVSGMGQALAGFVVDRLSARTVLFFGLGCFALSALLLSVAPTYPLLLVGSMLAGLGNSVFHPSDFTIMNQRVSEKRLGHAFSAHGISGNLGWAAAPIFLAGIASFGNWQFGAVTIPGWRMALFAAAFLPLLVIVLFFIHRQRLATPAAQVAVVSSSTGAAKTNVFGFLLLPQIWMCFAFFLINAFAMGGVQSFSPTSLRDLYGMPWVWANAGYTAFMLASAAGMLLGGFAAARSPRPDRVIGWAFAASGLMAFMIAVNLVPSWMALVLMGGVGLGVGIAGPSRDLLIRNAAPKHATGRVYGVVYSGNDIGLAIAPVLFGALMDGSHPAWVFILIGVFQFLAITTAVTVGTNTERRQAGEAQAA